MMSISEMQACVARLYVDDCFRKLFYLQPEDTVRDYRLSSEEAKALTGIDRKMLDFFAGSLKNKRKDSLARAYPLLFKVGGPAIDRYYQRYYLLHLADPHWPPHQDNLDFGIFAEESMAEADDVPAYTAEVARYERLCCLTNFGPAKQDADIERASLDSDSFGLEDYLQKPKGVGLETFVYDIPTLEETLQSSSANSSEVDLACGEYYLLFRPPSPSYESKVLRVNYATKALMDRCDGSRNIAQIISELERQFEASDLQERLFAAIRRLASSGALHIVRR